MKKLTQDHVLLLASQDNRTLAEWWGTLNHWGWVDALGPFEPQPEPWTPHTLRGEVMGWIMEHIGFKECLRAWNVHKDRMTDEEFETWWLTKEFPKRLA